MTGDRKGINHETRMTIRGCIAFVGQKLWHLKHPTQMYSLSTKAWSPSILKTPIVHCWMQFAHPLQNNLSTKISISSVGEGPISMVIPQSSIVYWTWILKTPVQLQVRARQSKKSYIPKTWGEYFLPPVRVKWCPEWYLYRLPRGAIFFQWFKTFNCLPWDSLHWEYISDK